MSISIGGIDLADSVINTEYRLGVLERVVDRLLEVAPPGTLLQPQIDTIRKEVLTQMQKKYPSAGITPKSI